MITIRNILTRQREVENIEFLIKESGKTSYAHRIRLTQNRLKSLLSKFLNNPKDGGLVKKSVRVNDDIYNVLCKITENDEKVFTKIISTAVLKEISAKQVDIFIDKWFRHKITVYFTQKEYRQIKKVLKEIKSKGLKDVTFSSLVRSILYKRLGIVIETHCKDTSGRLNRIVRACSTNC